MALSRCKSLMGLVLLIHRVTANTFTKFVAQIAPINEEYYRLRALPNCSSAQGEERRAGSRFMPLSLRAAHWEPPGGSQAGKAGGALGRPAAQIAAMATCQLAGSARSPVRAIGVSSCLLQPG